MERGILFVLFSFVLLAGLVFTFSLPGVSAQEVTVCCSETNSGASCQDVPATECADGATQAPTACESTSFCKPGTCFDSSEGTCLDNTPQLVCNDNGGIWSEESPAQCSLGCCVLGDQAAFVTLVRCKALSSHLGLETNYDSGIINEAVCITSVQNQDKGACVFEFEFERSCEFTTRAECDSKEQTEGEEGIAGGEFFKDILCSAEELGTTCGPTTDTTTILGKDEVYFVDTCGNPANIYDASKVNDQEYWTNVKGKAESCNPGSSNANSASCGNCNYLLGSFARDKDVAGGNPTYGDFICADLNCGSTSNGQSYRHGESWCVNNDQGSVDEGEASVGSRFFRHICINGEEVVETCDDFRAETCIQDDIGGFSQAACRVNRWQDCTAQTGRKDCENSDRRDCIWNEDVEFGSVNGTIQDGACLPKNPPGLNFWNEQSTANVCAQGYASCVVKFEKGVFGSNECVNNCHCLEEGWEQERAKVCTSLGDCGPNVNWIGEDGSRKGFKVNVCL